VLYDLQGNRISRKLVAKSRARVKVGPDPGSVYDLHPEKSYDFNAPFQPNFADAMDELLAAAGIGPSQKIASLFVPKKVNDFVAGWMKEKGLSPGSFACLHAGSAADFPSKRWPEENFAALARLIGDCGKSVVWLGASEDGEVNARLSRQTGIDATNVFSPLGVHALARHACFAVTADSGPMYLTAAAGIPVFAFFGPTSAQRCAVRGQEHRVLSNRVDCSPCDKKKCPADKGHACLAGISPQQVMEKILNDPESGLQKA
jgi:ADP-heptose:LPS heptosyltransferase